MSITDHAVFNDRFKLIESTGKITAQSFPCGCCQNCLCPPQSEPCSGCGHNANSLETSKSMAVAIGMSPSDMAELICEIADNLKIDLPSEDGVQLFKLRIMGLIRNNKMKSDALDAILNAYDRARKC